MGVHIDRLATMWGMALLGVEAISGTAFAATPSPAAAPIAVVKQLLDGWRRADFDHASATLAPDFHLVTLGKDEVKGAGGMHVGRDTLQSLQQAMRPLKPGDWDIRLGPISVQYDATGIATLWAPYTFYSFGKKDHCGIELYTLYRLNQGWRIIHFADTHLQDPKQVNCPRRPPQH